MPRPRLLFLCQTLPFPPDGGVQIRTYNVLRLLAREFQVTALCFYRAAVHPTAAKIGKSTEALARLAETVEAFPIPQEHHRGRKVWDHVRSVVLRTAYTNFVYDSASFRKRLTELLQTQHFDLVHVDSLDLAAYLPLLRGFPVVCVHHNVESALLRRRAATERSSLLRAYMRLQAELTEKEERRWIGRVALNVTVSEIDREAFGAMNPKAGLTVVPNGVDTDIFRPAADAPTGRLVFVGGYGWFPNRDALGYFAEEILPRIRERTPGVKVDWIGRAPAEVISSYRQAGIDLSGYVDDIRPHVHRAACYVVPLRVGGGTRLKILDAWAMGKAVVSTSIGCEGLDTRAGENILIRDTPEGFAAAVAEVLEDPALRERLARGARETAERTYSWVAIGQGMSRVYHELLTGSTRNVASNGRALHASA